MKESYELQELALYFKLTKHNFDCCLDAVFGLDHIDVLAIVWDQMSVDKIKSVMKKQGGNKQWKTLTLGIVDREINDVDILEICQYLPMLRECTWFGTGLAISTLTIEGAREWKRICPHLTFIQTGGFSEEVEELLIGLGVTCAF
jgi:hypothetical protein